MKPFFSIITATYNSSPFIEQCIRSLTEQSFQDFEHIIIDGNSSDQTLRIIEAIKTENHRYGKQLKLMSEEDSGVYDAFNKGLRLASGEYIFFLGGDDVLYSEKTLNAVHGSLTRRQNVALGYGDVMIFDRDLNTLKRYWRSSAYIENSFSRGWMPPFSGSFWANATLQKLGLEFDVSYRVAGDLKFIGQFLRNIDAGKALKFEPIVIKMRSGGLSSGGVESFWMKIVEDWRAYRETGLGFFNSLRAVVMKRVLKLSQLFFDRNLISS